MLYAVLSLKFYSNILNYLKEPVYFLCLYQLYEKYIEGVTRLTKKNHIKSNYIFLISKMKNEYIYILFVEFHSPIIEILKYCVLTQKQ